MYALRVAAALTCLAVGSYQDAKRREIDDWVWAVGAAFGLLLSAAEISSDLRLFWQLLHSYLAAVPLFLILAVSWRWKLMGEADILAYLMVAVLLPDYPSGLPWVLPPVFSTFIYSKLLLLLAPLAQLSYNLWKLFKDPKIMRNFAEPAWRKILALFFLSYSEGPSPYATPATSVSSDGRKKFKLSAVLSSPYGEGSEEPGWVVPSYPMIPLISIGVLLSIWLGDPVIMITGVRG